MSLIWDYLLPSPSLCILSCSHILCSWHVRAQKFDWTDLRRGAGSMTEQKPWKEIVLKRHLWTGGRWNPREYKYQGIRAVHWNHEVQPGSNSSTRYHRCFKVTFPMAWAWSFHSCLVSQFSSFNHQQQGFPSLTFLYLPDTWALHPHVCTHDFLERLSAERPRIDLSAAKWRHGHCSYCSSLSLFIRMVL